MQGFDLGLGSAVTLQRVRWREVPREGVTGGWNAGPATKASMSVPERVVSDPANMKVLMLCRMSSSEMRCEGAEGQSPYLI